MDYYSTPLNDSRTLQIAGVVGDLRDVTGAGSGSLFTATISPYFMQQGSHQPFSMLGRVQSSPPLKDKAMQTAMAETGESSTASAVASGKAPTSIRFDYIHMCDIPWQGAVLAALAASCSAINPAVAKPDASAAVAVAKQAYFPCAESTTEAALARSASAIMFSQQAMEQGQSAATPLAPVLSTALATSHKDVANWSQWEVYLLSCLPVKTTAKEDYPAVLQGFMGSILGQVLLGVFMLALGGVILSTDTVVSSTTTALGFF
ncbi:TPA: hypothetical protein ACH3X1_009855 [Trebouxia sp. C0004]